MVNLNNEYPDKEDIQEAFDRITASLRDDIADLQLLFKRVTDGRIFLSKAETAELLRCPVNELPKQLKKYHVGVNYIYKLSDVLEFVDSRRIGGKR